MSARNTAQIVRDVFLESELELPGINYQTDALYVRIGMSGDTCRGRHHHCPSQEVHQRPGPGHHEQGGTAR